MPDISMCKTESCPSAQKCYRFKARPKPRNQAYTGFTPNESGRCEFFIEKTKAYKEE